MVFPILTFVLLVASFSSCSAAGMSAEYAEINKYLEQKLPQSEDLKENIDLARVWLESRQDRLCGFGKCIGRGVNGALEDLLDLYSATKGENKCSDATLELLRKNRTGSGPGRDWISGSEEKTRIFKLVHAMAEEIAEDCTSDGESKFLDRLRSLDQVQLNTLNEHMDELMRPALLAVVGLPAGSTEITLHNYQVQHYFWDPSRDDDLVYTIYLIAKHQLKDIIPTTGFNELKSAWLKVNEFMEDYFFKPCQYFTAEMNDSYNRLSDHYKTKNVKKTYEKREINFAMGRFKWCQNLLAGKDRLITEITVGPLEPESIFATNMLYKDLPAPYN